ncbi:MAG: YihY/virulence factor BrkB family protein [Omnitrophica WOR_2 bacterium]
MKIKDFISFMKKVFKEWSEDKVSRLAAALSYYTVFSLAPFLVIIIAIIGLILGNQQNVQNQVMVQIQDLVGQSGAQAIQSMIEGARRPSSSIIAAMLGVVFLLLGASGLFGQLQDSLNTIWEVTPKPNQGILGIVKQRFFSFAMVLGIAFLLLVSLIISTVLSALGRFTLGLFPGFDVIMQVINFIFSFAVVTLLFALMFKYLPDVKISWGDVWFGSIVTALLFTIGKFLIGLYLGRSSYTSTYGAAGSLVILLLWIYYSGQILFLGAEVTKVYANQYGTRIVPEPNAVSLTEAARAQQGIPHRQTLEKDVGVKQAEALAQKPSPVVAFQRTAPQGEKVEKPLIPEQKSLRAFGALASTLALVFAGLVTKLVVRRPRGC